MNLPLMSAWRSLGRGMSVESKLKKIMNLPRADRWVALLELAKELGCSLQAVQVNGTVIEDDIILRIRAADSARNATRMWWITFAAAVASAISAIAAWAAVIYKAN